MESMGRVKKDNRAGVKAPDPSNLTPTISDIQTSTIVQGLCTSNFIEFETRAIVATHCQAKQGL